MANFSEDTGQMTLFRNWVVATTSKASRRGAGSEAVDKPNFKRLLNMVKRSGATHSKIVHKRVKFLVSTDDAYKFKTQSVRKAIKYGIPILHQAFLSTILETGVVPLKLDSYVLSSNGNDMSTYFAKLSVKKSEQTELLPLNDNKVQEKAEIVHNNEEEQTENADKDSMKVKKKKKKKEKKKKKKKHKKEK